MSTAVVITAAATFWCTRRFRSCAIKPIKATASITAPVSSAPQAAPSSISPADDCSYLCTACGTEKYSPEQQVASFTNSKSLSPFKMVILVRTDLNMV